MKISKIRIDGYRLLNNFNLDLRDDLSLVIGKNNTGKTSLLNILSSYLASSQPTFTFEDFSLSAQKQLLAQLMEISPRPPESYPSITLTLEIEYDENDNLRHLSHLMVDLSPESRTVNLRFQTEISIDGFNELSSHVDENLTSISKALEKQLTDSERRDEIQRFLSKNLRKYLTRTIMSFDPHDAANTLDLTNEPAAVRRVLNLEYVSARRSVENRDTGKGGRPAGRALSHLSSDYFKDHTGGNESSTPFIRLAAQAAVTDRAFTETYKTVFEDVIDKVKRFGAEAGLTGNIHVTSNIEPTTLLNDSTSVKYGDPETLLPEDHNGLGYLNLIAIIMEIEIRILRMRKATEEGPANINLLVIEEPEAHTHPQLQYIFIKQIKKLLSEQKKTYALQLQTIITTHSSHITAESDFADIKYFLRVDEHVEARNMTDLEERYDAETNEYHFLVQYLTLTRAELFFADKAILIEGDTERILIRAMMRKLDDADVDHESPISSQNISVVEVGAHSHIFDAFIEFTGLKTLIITDIDSAKPGPPTEGKKPGLKACPVNEGTHTTNHSLKHFLYLGQSEDNASTGDLQDLRNRSLKQKLLSKKNGVWQPDADAPILFIAYQTKENNYEARSYEDAFISLNLNFIKDNLKNFNGLKNIHFFRDRKKTAYDLANDCVKKKTHFALDVIYASTSTDSQWNTPSYIKEGLRWLRDA